MAHSNLLTNSSLWEARSLEVSGHIRNTLVKVATSPPGAVASHRLRQSCSPKSVSSSRDCHIAIASFDAWPMTIWWASPLWVINPERHITWIPPVGASGILYNTCWYSPRPSRRGRGKDEELLLRENLRTQHNLQFWFDILTDPLGLEYILLHGLYRSYFLFDIVCTCIWMCERVCACVSLAAVAHVLYERI